MKLLQGSLKTRTVWVSWMHKSAVKWRQEFRRCSIARTLLADTPRVILILAKERQCVRYVVIRGKKHSSTKAKRNKYRSVRKIAESAC
jgi:hypothetical protein